MIKVDCLDYDVNRELVTSWAARLDSCVEMWVQVPPPPHPQGMGASTNWEVATRVMRFEPSLVQMGAETSGSGYKRPGDAIIFCAPLMGSNSYRLKREDDGASLGAPTVTWGCPKTPRSLSCMDQEYKTPDAARLVAKESSYKRYERGSIPRRRTKPNMDTIARYTWKAALIGEEKFFRLWRKRISMKMRNHFCWHRIPFTPLLYVHWR